MDTYKKHSIAKLWIAGAMMMAFFFATSALAQDTTAVDSPAVAPAVAEAVAPAAEAAPDTVGDLVLGLNTVWMLLAAALVFFMQPGFALVEAGFTRSKNTANILMKNFVDFLLGSLLYWAIGF